MSIESEIGKIPSVRDKEGIHLKKMEEIKEKVFKEHGIFLGTSAAVIRYCIDQTYLKIEK